LRGVRLLLSWIRLLLRRVGLLLRRVLLLLLLLLLRRVLPRRILLLRVGGLTRIGLGGCLGLGLTAAAEGEPQHERQLGSSIDKGKSHRRFYSLCGVSHESDIVRSS
jgi:hypothetical protein